MDFFAPHKNVQFEGYFSRFTLPSKATLVIIVCSVPLANNRPHLVSVTYCPATDGPIYQQEIYPQNLQFALLPAGRGFELNVPEVGSIVVNPDSTTTYCFDNPAFAFKASTTSRTPWSSRVPTPESWLVYLPLPLHWHVHSLASSVDFTLSLRGSSVLSLEDRKGTAVVHQEKNWAKSFPSAHIWLQTYDASTKRGLCLAGGRILGMEAWLVGYRNAGAGLEIDFRPPFALKVLGMSPFLSATPDWETRSFTMSVQDFRHKLSVHAYVDREDWDRFFGHSAPFADGHRPNFLAENFRAKAQVEVSRRSWPWESWQLLLQDKFEDVALEFGGDFYPLRGKHLKPD